MNPIRRLAAALTGLACAWLGIAIAAPATFAATKVRHPVSGPPGIRVLHDPPGLNKHPPLPARHVTGPAHQVYTVVVSGMPGWQIAPIAIGAALLAATAAVLAYRAWAARRKPATAGRQSHAWRTSDGERRAGLRTDTAAGTAAVLVRNRRRRQSAGRQ